MAYLTNLVNLMILEDSTRSNLPTTRPEDTGIVRRLPVISKAFANPMSERMKAEQETRVANLMTPEGHSWYTKIYNEYYDKISVCTECWEQNHVSILGSNVHACLSFQRKNTSSMTV